MSSFFKKKDKKLIEEIPEKPDESINEISKMIYERLNFPKGSEEGKKFISERKAIWSNFDADKSQAGIDRGMAEEKQINKEEMS